MKVGLEKSSLSQFCRRLREQSSLALTHHRGTIMLQTFEIEILFALDRVIERAFTDVHYLQQIAQRSIRIPGLPKQPGSPANRFFIIELNSSPHDHSLPYLV